MSHHSDEPFDGAEGPNFQKRQALFRSLMETTAEFRGALGTFPAGKLVPHDEGAIQFAVKSEGDKVVLDFGTSVRWVGMTPQDAADLASSLMKWARLVGRKNGETITMTIGGT